MATMIDYGCTCVEKEDWKGWFDENTLIDSSINCVMMKLVGAGIWMVLYFELGFVERERGPVALCWEVDFQGT
jgi:hypothetical protein